MAVTCAACLAYAVPYLFVCMGLACLPERCMLAPASRLRLPKSASRD